MKRTYCPPAKRKNQSKQTMNYVRNVGIKHQKEKEKKEVKRMQQGLHIYATAASHSYELYDF